ncbi:MAG: HD domain-containing protein [Prevotella sp.]|nr:HD domain-containing protein [Prevotella sp.]
MSEGKIINDPVFGFIKIPGGLLMDIVNHPLMQRLRHIKQVGLASVVYPGAQHTRFQHSLGAYYLMSEALLSLAQKGIFIFDSEAEAMKAAIPMHDIGHGPFSHVLENTLIHGVSHEDISLLFMEQINREMNGELNMALTIFKDQYPKRFLHQLISSQLDMDRLDYLRRDSFFTGVTEGNIGSARIIKMLNVVDDQLVVDSKGIYSIENYLTSRRLMYWQVYLHKTTVASEKVLVNVLLRAKYLTQAGVNLFASPALSFFLCQHVDANMFHAVPDVLSHYSQLDDNDIYSAIKEWRKNDDTVLRILCENIVERRPFRVEVSETPFTEERIAQVEEEIRRHVPVSEADVKYLYSVSEIQKDMYDVNDDHITILYKDGTMKDIADASEILNVALLSKKIRKYYLCYQRF